MAPEPRIDAIVFDLDGTIIDTEPSAARALVACFKNWGVTLDPTDAVYVTGRTWGSAFDYLLGKYAVPVTRDEVVRTVLEAYRETLEGELVVVPGAVEAIRSLAAKYPLALVSGSGRAEILWALRKLGVESCFRAIFGAEDYPRSKPAPDGYLKALAALGVKGENAVAFEDSNAGIASALDAGMWVVAISATNHFAQNIDRAHQHVRDLTDVNPAWIEKVGRTFRK